VHEFLIFLDGEVTWPGYTFDNRCFARSPLHEERSHQASLSFSAATSLFDKFLEVFYNERPHGSYEHEVPRQSLLFVEHRQLLEPRETKETA
jgi:hypothetical protein